MVDGAGEDAGKLLIQRVDGDTVETMFVITIGQSSTTVQGVNSAASYGTDTIINVEQLHFGIPMPTFDPARFVSVNLVASHFDANIVGSEGDDFIRVADYAGARDVFANRGNDTVVGDSQDNYIAGGAGNDRIDGGAGRDTAAFHLPKGTTGSLRLVEGVAEHVVELVQEDGSASPVFRISFADGKTFVMGLGIAAHLGTDELVSVEGLNFMVETWPDPTPDHQNLHIGIAPFVPEIVNNFAHVGGSIANDVIDLSQLYPSADLSVNLNANGGSGNDTITGHAGSNWIAGEAGDDAEQETTLSSAEPAAIH
jgi:Ca2+-binding RTX toxin-like protein